MTKKFSTTSSTPVENPLNDLPFVFYDEFDPTNNETPTDTITIPPQQQTNTNINSNIDSIDSNESNDSEPNLETVINYSDVNTDDLTIEELLQLKLNQYNIQNVTIKHLGYNTIDEYIITEYDVIDNQTNRLLLVVNVHLKQIRFQNPKNKRQDIEPKKRGTKSKKKTDMTPMELVAHEMQKELRYNWSDWF